MAITIGPAFSENARGKIGGITYCSGRSVSIAKPTTFGCNSLTARQTHQRREVFAAAVQWWTNMAYYYYEPWNEFAKCLTFVSRLGRPYSPSARQVFFRLACAAAAAGYGMPNSPPNQILPEYFPTLEITFPITGAQITWDFPIPANNTICVSQRRNLNLGAIKPRKTVTSHWFTSADSSPQIICPPLGGGGGPGDLPACISSTQVHFHAWICDSLGRTSVRQFWKLVAV